MAQSNICLAYSENSQMLIICMNAQRGVKQTLLCLISRKSSNYTDEKVTNHLITPTLTSTTHFPYGVTPDVVQRCHLVQKIMIIFYLCYPDKIKQCCAAPLCLCVGRKTILLEIVMFVVCIRAKPVKNTAFTYGKLIPHKHVAFSCRV